MSNFFLLVKVSNLKKMFSRSTSCINYNIKYWLNIRDFACNDDSEKSTNIYTISTNFFFYCWLMWVCGKNFILLKCKDDQKSGKRQIWGVESEQKWLIVSLSIIKTSPRGFCWVVRETKKKRNSFEAIFPHSLGKLKKKILHSIFHVFNVLWIREQRTWYFIEGEYINSKFQQSRMKMSYKRTMK